MTTEAGPETEVKENAEESAAQPDQSEKTQQEFQEVANAEGEEKEKDGKGISRYLPTWFKKQKSQSQVKYAHTAIMILLLNVNAAVDLFVLTHLDLPD